MAKPQHTPPAPSAEKPSGWPLIFAGTLGAIAGGTGTYLALAPSLRAPAPVAAMTAVATPVIADNPASHEPAPALTAGQTPAQADRTLGNFYYDHENWPLASQHYEAAISQGSNDADIRTDLGNAYRFAGRPQDALVQYQLAQKMNPAHEFSLFNQGGLYFEELKQPQQAIAAWNEYLARFPQGANAATARQLIVRAQGSGTGFVAPATAAASAPSTAEDLILQRIKSAQSGGSKP